MAAGFNIGTLKYAGAFVRWVFNGFKPSYQHYLDIKGELGLLNIFLGAIVWVIGLFLFVWILELLGKIPR